MNESFLLRFESKDSPRNVVDFTKEQGVVFDRHPDASPLVLALGLQPLQPVRLDPVRQRHAWLDKQFLLDGAMHEGGIRLSGYDGDAYGLPPGVYDLTVEVESMRFRDAAQRITLNEDQQVVVTMHEKPDHRDVALRNNIDASIAHLINEPRSEVDREQLSAWLGNPTPWAARKACLLNILTKMCVPPGITAPLISTLEFIYFADVDRVYAAARPDVGGDLEQLVGADLWVKEGYPAAPIHKRLLDSLARFNIDEATRARFALTSYRQGGRNCLQIVVASPPGDYANPTVYLDIDMDLGNPLWDFEGLIVHLSEVLDTARTDHFALRRALDKGETKRFLCYDIVRA